MIRRLKSKSVVAGGIVLALLSAACVQLAPSIASPSSSVRVAEAPVEGASAEAVATVVGAPGMEATVVPGTTSSAGRQTVAVRRGRIAERLSLNGRVAAMEEVPITFPGLGRVESVAVKPGDTVEQGQVLLFAETTEIERELSAARARLELGSLRLE
jgi:multidrug efflux pump subunit AcrA (membrane-fusion protein)